MSWAALATPVIQKMLIWLNWLNSRNWIFLGIMIILSLNDWLSTRALGQTEWEQAKSLQTSLTLSDPMDCSPPGCSVHGDSPDKYTGVGCHAFLQGIFPAQEWNPYHLCLLHWQHVFTNSATWEGRCQTDPISNPHASIFLTNKTLS